jgi:hypothetical protein
MGANFAPFTQIFESEMDIFMIQKILGGKMFICIQYPKKMG